MKIEVESIHEHFPPLLIQVDELEIDAGDRQTQGSNLPLARLMEVDQNGSCWINNSDHPAVQAEG